MKKNKLLASAIVIFSFFSFLYAGTFDGLTWYPNQTVTHIRPNNTSVFFNVSGGADYMYISSNHPSYFAMISALLQAQALGLYVDFHTTSNDAGTDYHNVDAIDIHR